MDKNEQINVLMATGQFDKAQDMLDSTLDLGFLIETGQIEEPTWADKDPDALYQEYVEIQLTEEDTLTGGLERTEDA